MITVNIHEAKTHLSHLLSEIEKSHETIRICRRGQAIAELKAIDRTTRNPLIQCDILKTASIHYDATSPLSDDEWPEDQGAL